MALFTFINKPQSDFTISRGFYFHVTSHPQFHVNKTLAKIFNLHYHTTSRLGVK